MQVFINFIIATAFGACLFVATGCCWPVFYAATLISSTLLCLWTYPQTPA